MTKRVIMSVPHSGTRSLVDHLGIDQHAQGLMSGRWWHFGSHDHELSRVMKGRHEINIPIRNPLDVAQGWAARDKTGKVLDSMLMRFELMFELLDNDDADIVLHRVEDIPKTKGHGEWVDNPSTSRIHEFQDAVIESVVIPHKVFYEQFYPGLSIDEEQ